MSWLFLLFALFHAIVPAACAVLYSASPLWILGSIVFSAAVYVTAVRSTSSRAKFFLCLISGLYMWSTLMLAASFYMQGTGFNQQYFFHLDSQTLIMAMEAYGHVFYPAIAWCLLAFFAPLLLFRRQGDRSLSAATVIALWVLAIAAAFPLHSLMTYQLDRGAGISLAVPEHPELDSSTERLADTMEQETERSPEPKGLDGEESRSKKNVILIYAEGLEQLYFDQEVFGEIVPNLRKMSEQALVFTNVYQLPGTSWTIAGVVASQCGFPLVVSSHLASNSTMESTEKPFEEEECLADILQDSGYETVFMGGAPLSFAGKGNFLRTHGFQKVAGREELLPLLPDPAYRKGWGLYDDSLFDLALQELTRLEAGEQPYLLTLLTLDTHHPRGEPSKSCKPLPDNQNPMSNAVYCSDQLISRFIEQAREITDRDETVIVLFSDHLALRNTLWEEVLENKDRRRLMWMIFDEQPGRSSDQVATHFDVAPTVLEKAGIAGYSTLNQGMSLAQRSNLRPSDNPPSIDLDQAPRVLVSDTTIKEAGFEIVYADLEIKVGDFSVRAAKSGGEFNSGLFLLVFDEEGIVSDIIHSDDFELLMRELNGLYVVGLSVHPEGSEFEDQFFFGRLTQNLDRLKIQPLRSDVSVGVSQLGF